MTPLSFKQQGSHRVDAATDLLAPAVAARIWRGSEMGCRSLPVVGTGMRRLDAELPGGGWPCQSLTEVLAEPGAHCEWRLLSPALGRIQKRGGTLFLIGAPQTPHLPGLRLMGIDERRLVWIFVDSPRERLWATQQIIASGQAGAIMAWLPRTDAQALRRLQAGTQACQAPVFVMRPLSVQHDTSPAPLRVETRFGAEAWMLKLRIVKRRGPPLEEAIDLPSIPGGLAPMLARRAASMASQAAARPQASKQLHADMDAGSGRSVGKAVVAAPAIARPVHSIVAPLRSATQPATAPSLLTPSLSPRPLPFPVPASPLPSHPTPELAHPAVLHAPFALSPFPSDESHDESLAGPVLPAPRHAVAG